MSAHVLFTKFVTLIKSSQAMVDMKTILDESPTARLLQALHNRNVDEVHNAILAGAKIVDSNFNALEYALQKAVVYKSGAGLKKEFGFCLRLF